MSSTASLSRRFQIILAIVAFVAVWAVLVGRARQFRSGEASNIRADEKVILFPAAAIPAESGRTWRIAFRAWVFESEEDDAARAALVRTLREALDIEDPSESQTFRLRVRRFLVDNERGKELRVRIGERLYTIGTSGADGHVEPQWIEVPAAAIEPLLSDDKLTVQLALPRRDRRRITSTVHLVEPHGLCIVSDIDDTIKISNVRDKKELLANTFLRPFGAVPGMAELYRRWVDSGAVLHYVSSSPWQLYEPLSEFTAEAGFPDAVWHLNKFRLKDSSVLDLFADPMETKTPIIQQLMADMPRRRFILIGDSGEADPEVYGELARRAPEKVFRIFIRDVTGQTRDDPRYQQAFHDVRDDKWAIFTDPSELMLPGE